MPSIGVRPASEPDLPALREVYRRSSLSNEGDRALLAVHPELLEWADTPVRENRTRAAVIEGRVVGFASMSIGRAVLEIEDLLVDPDWMRQGVGRALTEDAMAIARAKGLLAVEVDANPHAREFYAKVGFEDRGQFPVKYGVAIRMCRGTGEMAAEAR